MPPHKEPDKYIFADLEESETDIVWVNPLTTQQVDELDFGTTNQGTSIASKVYVLRNLSKEIRNISIGVSSPNLWCDVNTPGPVTLSKIPWTPRSQRPNLGDVDVILPQDVNRYVRPSDGRESEEEMGTMVMLQLRPTKDVEVKFDFAMKNPEVHGEIPLDIEIKEFFVMKENIYDKSGAVIIGEPLNKSHTTVTSIRSPEIPADYFEGATSRAFQEYLGRGTRR